jgi:hypothetical protein
MHANGPIYGLSFGGSIFGGDLSEVESAWQHSRICNVGFVGLDEGN